jgi:hypothetical protein
MQDQDYQDATEHQRELDEYEEAMEIMTEWKSNYEREEKEMDRSGFNPPPRTETDLKAKDFVGKNMKLIIREVDTVTYNEGAADENSKTVLYFEDKEKRVVLNASNNQILCTAYGSDDTAWVGKEVGLTTKDYSDKGFDPGWILSALDVEFEEAIPF